MPDPANFEGLSAEMRGRQTLEKRANAADRPLSWTEEWLWLLDRTPPGAGAYNIPLHLRLAGQLDVEAMERGLTEIVRRHEVLRSTYQDAGGRPVQRVLPPWPVELVPILLAGAGEEEVARLASEEARKPFDLARGPLFRASLLRLSQGEHVLLLTAHQIVFDRWSAKVLLDELSLVYSAFAASAPSPLPELSLQFAEFASRERRRIEGPVLDRELDYRGRLLVDPLPTLQLPIGNPRGPALTSRREHESLVLPLELSLALEALARREGATPFITLLACFLTLLHRYTGQDDILVGSPASTRGDRAAEALIGCFMNTLVLRGRLQGDPSFRELLARTREMAVEAFEHQALSLERLECELRPGCDGSRASLVQALFVAQDAALPLITLPGLTIQPLEVSAGSAGFDLALHVIRQPGGYATTLEYREELFPAKTAGRMLEHYRNLLESIVADPDMPVSRLSFLTAAELHAVRGPAVMAAAPAASYPTIPAVFERQAETSPDSVAVICEDRQITYGELNQRANRLAHYLRGRGVGPEVPVAILLDRSIEMVVAILAVLKAGGFYVPLDPDHPQQRLTFILQDTGVRLILSRRSVATSFSPALAEVVCLDALEEQLSTADSGDLPAESTRDNAAYAIYTSGSTGLPKGVLVTHANVVRLFEATREEYGFNPRDVWTLFHSYAFDFSVWEIWGALFYGGRLVIVPYWVCRSPSAMLDLLRAHHVTVLNQTPSAFRQLIAVPDIGHSFRSLALRLVVFGGEPLDPQCLAAWFKELGDEHPRMVNMYGITETTVHVTHRRMRQSDLSRPSSPIGAPIADLRLYLLDRNAQPVPFGVTGEIHVSGPGLARGYIGAPDLTAARFPPDPFTTVPGARMYRSGDLARRLENGEIEYVGRIDSQVKIRGYRIEPQEVAAVLAAHKDVLNSVVVPWGEGDHKRLVAYYSVRRDCSPAAADLRRLLADHLPDYMIPAQFIEMAELPLTPNGKVDRGALPEPRLEDRSAASEITGRQAPQTPEEEALAGIAGKLLNLPVLGCEEDLFDLGMHSLLAGRMAAEMRQRFGARTGIKEIFETRTVRALAARLAEQSVHGAGPEEGIPRTHHRENVPLTWQQEQIWYLTKLAPGNQAYNSQFTLHLLGKLDQAALVTSLNGLIHRHEILRTTFRDAASGPVQMVHAPWPAEIDMVDLSHLAPTDREEASEAAIREATRYVFDCSTLPLVKWVLYRLGDEDHVLLHIEHHLVHDGWEVAVLLRELQEFYAAAVEGRPAALEELSIQYADYAVWQRSYLSGETLARKLDYWEERLRDYPHALDLTTDHERPAVQSFRGGAVLADMDRDLYAALREFSRQRKVTLFVTMYSAFALLLARYSGQRRLLVGTGVANRTRQETECLLGMLVNAVVLTTDLTADPTFEDLLAATQRTMLEDAVHHDAPFMEVVRHLRAGNAPDRNPLFQVLFAFHDSAVPVMEFAGLRGTIVERHNGSAKMDMNLLCVPRAEQHVGDRRSRAGEEDLTLIWEHNSDLFEQRTIERMLAHYLNLLREILAAPARKVSEFDIVPASERTAILQGFNQTRMAYDRDRTLWELFELEAARHPEKPAVVHNGTIVTYDGLVSQAGTVAAALSRTLRGKALVPGFAVGLSVGRGPAMVAGMLGILRAGGAYLPAPPEYPEDRLRLMLRDANAACVLAERPALNKLRRLGDACGGVLDLDELLEQSNPAGDAPPCAPAGSESAAYIIYTSGSTGVPKGTLIPHRAVNNLVLSLRRDLQGPDDVVAQLSDYAFDATIFEIWGTLLTGGTLVIVDNEAVTDPERLEHVLAENGVTAAWFTASLFSVISEMRPQILANLRTVATGGEKVNPRAVERVMAQSPGTVRVWNGYGPTECTCFSTDCLFTPRHLKAGSLPIGRPLINYTAYVLDQRRNLVPVGVPGELYIGGDGLALGYLNQPELTESRFVPNPFATAENRREGWNARLYKTGDRVRWLEDGNLEFLGRLDEQIKIRGFRVEPGEIETVVRRHPGVQEAVVRLWERAPGDQRLVCYVVASNGVACSAAGLQAYLGQRLPKYMTPSAFVLLDRMPLTRNGKVDRHALPAPELAAPGSDADGERPRTPLEETLARIWEAVLGLDHVGVHDNFFDLGGHSLLAVRMVHRIEKVLDRRIPVSTLFTAPTIRELATVLLHEEQESRSPIIPVQSGSGHTPFFFFHGDWEGGALYCRNLARQIGEDRPFYAIPPHGLDGGTVPATIQAMAADRLEPLLAVQPEGPFLLGGYCAGGLVALELARLLQERGQQVELVVLLDSVAEQGWRSPWRLFRRRLARERQHLLNLAGEFAGRHWYGRMAFLMEIIKRRLFLRRLPADRSPVMEGVDWERGAPSAYLRSAWQYRLSPYAGRISLLLTRDSSWDLNPEPPWRGVARNMEVHWVSGSHTTVLTVHLAETAGAIRASLVRVEEDMADPVVRGRDR